MSRLDLVRLRKRAGMSQRELAAQLQVRPSFLSAIENGKSRIPEEKLERIKEIFDPIDLEDYLIDDSQEIIVPPHTHVAAHNHLNEPSETITQLLNHFHELAHQREKSNCDAENEARIDFLAKRNDRLSQRVDDLREEVDKLRVENLHLKELLIKHGIDY